MSGEWSYVIAAYGITWGVLLAYYLLGIRRKRRVASARLRRLASGKGELA